MFENSLCVSVVVLFTDLAPISFISYFKESAFVVTSSFHGTVFSVIFQKPFCVVGMDRLGGVLLLYWLS